MTKYTLQGIALALLIINAQSVMAKTLYFNLTNASAETDTNKRIIVSFNISSVNVSPSAITGYSKLDFKNAKESHEVGAPRMPFKSLLVQDYPKNIKVHSLLGPKYNIDHVIEPAQEMPCRCKNDLKQNTKINSDLYLNSRLYKKIYLGKIRGVPVTKINFYAGRYVDHQLELYPKAIFSVESLKGSLSTLENANFSENNKMLIVTHDSLISGVSTLVEYKRSLGFDVTLVEVNNIHNTTEKLSEFIKEEYDKSKFSYALLVGHEEKIATYYKQTTFDTNTPSDLAYFLLDSGIEKDHLPDVYYARLPVDNNDEVLNYVAKLKEYDSLSSVVHNALGIASNEGSDPTDEEYIKQMLTPLEDIGYKATYLIQNNLDSNPEKINEAFDEGLNWINYIGHGSGSAWPSLTTDEYTSTHIPLMRGNNNKPIIIDVACQNGRFTYEGRLGERFINERGETQLGALAYYGGSVDISWHPPAVMAIGINKAMTLENNQSLGKILMAGQLHLLANFDDEKAALENLIWYHLLGDPSLKIKH